jgi:uncharacterized protein (UPF0332 family)
MEEGIVLELLLLLLLLLLFDESEETFEAAKLLFENGYYGYSINRVYYLILK